MATPQRHISRQRRFAASTLARTVEVDVPMMKSALLVLCALSLTACVGTSVDTQTDAVTLGKNETMTSCPGLTGVSAEYSRSVGGLPFRCGPQTQSPVTFK